MNRSKRLVILAGALLVVCAITLVVSNLEEKKEQIKNMDEVILEIPTESVTSLSWKAAEESDNTEAEPAEKAPEELSFHKEEHWIYDEDEAFPVDDEKIDKLLAQFQEFGASFIIEDAEDLSQYGLDKPVCTIHLETEDGSHEIQLGDFSSMDSQRYVSIGDGNVYLVSHDPMEEFDSTLRELIKHDDTPNLDHTTEIHFDGDDSYSVIRKDEDGPSYRESDIYFTEKDGQFVPLDTAATNSYLHYIANLTLHDYKTYNASDEELAAYGLDDPELSVTISYIRTDEEENETAESVVLHVSRDPEQKKLAAEAENAPEEEKESSEETNKTPIPAYARVGDSKIIYEISEYDFDKLMQYTYDDLRHKEIVPADFEDIAQIDVTLEGQTHTLTSEMRETEKDGEKTEERVYFYQGEEQDISGIRNAINSLKASFFLSEEPTQKQEISLTVYLDMEGTPAITIDLYRYNGTDCLAQVNGQTVALVERDRAVELIEKINTIVLNGSAEVEIDETIPEK